MLALIPEPIALETIEALAKEYGYWAVFLGISLENAGIPLPGETITLVGGFLAGSGELSYGGVLGTAVSGAILGDNVGYWLGRWGGWPLLLRLGKLFRIGEDKLDKAREQFSNNAGKAVFWGRFVALLRIFAGPMAGLTEMPYGKFLAYNAAGAAVWAGVTVTAAYFCGRLVSLDTLMKWASQFTWVMLLIVSVAIGISLWLENRKKSTPLG
jgi:membrane protein DedA with SNARE-associated domain